MPEILAQLDPGVQRLPEFVLTIGPTMLLHGQRPSQQFRLIVVKFPAIQNAEKGRREPKLRTRRQAAYQGHAVARKAQQRIENTSQAPAPDLHREILPRLPAHRPTLPRSDVGEGGFGGALTSRT